MEQVFLNELNAFVSSDPNGLVRDILYRGDGYVSRQKEPLSLAREYLAELGQQFGIASAELDDLGSRAAFAPNDAARAFRFLDQKSNFDTTTVAFDQTIFDIPVWRAGVSITYKPDSGRILHVTSTLHRELDVKKPSKRAIVKYEKLTVAELREILAGSEKTDGSIEWGTLGVNRHRFMVYQYEAKKREQDHEDRKEDFGFQEVHYSLPLKPVDQSIVDGRHYVVVEILFSLTYQGLDLNWYALVDAETGSVLMLRALIDHATGWVFEKDPSTLNNTVGPASNAATLDPFRTNVALPNVNVPGGGAQWQLTGSNVSVVDWQLPTIAPPTSPTGNWAAFSSRSNDAAAVNLYYHANRFFDMIAGMGFPLATYFDGTTFPVELDHRGGGGTGITVNASCPGNAGGNGIGRGPYMLADTTDTVNPLGIACDYRVVLHELGGHGILWDHVSWPNFGFAHSAGDSIAAILNDPGTAQVGPDRFWTFPFTFQSLPLASRRRHDRDLAGGWAWGGTRDLNGYSSEQILATSHFRVYRSIGGDSTHLPAQEFAARFMTYLILRAVGSLTPATNPPNPLPYVNALIAADAGDWTTEGHAGGAYHKVIRWAFEEQGLYQPAGAPTPVTSAGAPPAQDVYIDDGRAGEYPYQPVHWANQSIWNRIAADGLPGHENPIVGVTNYAYVTIHNRGTQPATTVRVRGFHCNPGVGLVWPNDWQPMATASISAPNLAPGASAVVGPFSWVPSQVGHECMLMVVDSAGDASNIDLFTGGTDSIPEWRLVPHDNNIGQRNVTPVPASSGGLSSYIKLKSFAVINSIRKRTRIRLLPELPDLLVRRGWKIQFVSAGQDGFTLEPGERKTVAFTLEGGEPFTADDVAKMEPQILRITGTADGIPIGGMAYHFDPKMKEYKDGGDPVPTGQMDLPTLLKCLGGKVKGVKVRKINVDIILDDDCDCD